jgi:hypothetical protein
VLLLLLDLLVVDFAQSTCNVTLSRNGSGAILTQVLANADIGGYDGAVMNKSHLRFHQLTTNSAGDMSVFPCLLPNGACSQVKPYNMVPQA